MRSRHFGLLALTLLLAAACRTNVAAPTSSAAFGQLDLRIGTGAIATTGSTLAVNYSGWLYDGNAADHKGAEFDTNGGTPFSFVLGTSTVIAGWDQGVVGMKEGGVRRLIIPPSLAYGADRHGIIPPNATLVFDIELVTVTSP